MKNMKQDLTILLEITSIKIQGVKGEDIFITKLKYSKRIFQWKLIELEELERRFNKRENNKRKNKIDRNIDYCNMSRIKSK